MGLYRVQAVMKKINLSFFPVFAFLWHLNYPYQQRVEKERNIPNIKHNEAFKTVFTVFLRGKTNLAQWKSYPSHSLLNCKGFLPFLAKYQMEWWYKSWTFWKVWLHIQMGNNWRTSFFNKMVAVSWPKNSAFY